MLNEKGSGFMEDVNIILSALWVTLMLIYLFGDVLRLYAGDFTPLDLENKTSEIDSDKKPRLESINDYFSKLAEAEEN
jgi:hypothetical protein